MKRNLLFGFLLLGLSSTAASMPITFEFTGEVDYIINRGGVLNGLGIAVGSTVSGSFSYELVQDEKHGGPYDQFSNSAQYSALSLSFILNDIFHYTAVAAGDYPVLQIFDNNPSVDDQLLLTTLDGPGELGDNTINRFDTSLGFDFLSLSLALRDYTGNAFSSLAVPDSLDFADFHAGDFSIEAYSTVPQGGYRITGRLTSLRAAVPEPATALLMIAGIAALARRRSLKSQ